MTSLLERLRELDEKATPGPWIPMMDEATMELWIAMPDPTSAHGQTCNASFDPPGNADTPLVASLRNALPAVVALVEAANSLLRVPRTVERDEDGVYRADFRPQQEARKKLAETLAPFVSEATPPEGTK